MSSSPQPIDPNPFQVGNVRLFVAFRVLFNARFYYPVFAILFLDFGLTLEQFAILNVLWAVTIVLAEVPSGVLADVLGRRVMVLAAAVLMVLEMSLLLFVPLGNNLLLFLVFCLNRICSGLAEAAASGADEALAYDSLKEVGLESQWPTVLERLTRYMAMGFFLAMVLGALVYDPERLQSMAHWVGWEVSLTQEDVLRLPILLTFGTSLIALVCALRMREVGSTDAVEQTGSLLREAIQSVMAAARWTLGHRFVLFVILGGLLVDSVARQFVIIGTEYYRLIEIPIYLFGWIAAGMSLLGILYARLGKHMATRLSPLRNFLLLSITLLVGLLGIAWVLPVWGVLFVPLVFAMMTLVGFLQSYYINQHVESRWRATVLSFRGLALNLGLGINSLLYTGLIAHLKHRHPATEEEVLHDAVFAEALAWFPGYFLILMLIFLLAGRLCIRRLWLCHQTPK